MRFGEPYGSLGRLMSRRMLPVAAAVVLIAGAGARADDRSDAREIVARAAGAVQDFRGGSDRDTVDALLARASGVIVYPSIVKAAFLFGGEGGTGVLLGRDAARHWSDPAFVTFGAASYGLQAGVEESEVLMIIMNEETLERAVRGGLEFGPNATVAAGSEGLKGKLLSTDRLQDIHYFAKSHGLFARLNLKGASTKPRDGLNAAFYGTPVTAEDVVLHRKVSSDGATVLVTALGG